MHVKMAMKTKSLKKAVVAVKAGPLGKRALPVISRVCPGSVELIAS